jgi:hypothetical protein
MQADDIKKYRGGSIPDIDTLEAVADWREDLTMRIRIARLQQEFDWVDPEQVIALSAETESFRRVAQALKGVIRNA